MKQTQGNFFEKRYIGESKSSGISFPNFQKIAAAFDLPYILIEKVENMQEKIAEVLGFKGPVFCEVKLATDYIFAPKLSSLKLPDGRMISKPLEDMFPFLDREEFKNNMIVPIVEE